MNNGGDAAEQVVRLSLEGFEVAAKLTGSAAKNVALLLVSVLKQEQQTKGKARLTNMIKSGKELKVFSIPNKDLAQFTKQAKRYGVLYCVLRDKSAKGDDVPVDIIARAEDASKIQRIVERFEIGKVDKAGVITQAEQDKADREAVAREVPTKTKGEIIVEEAMGKPLQKEGQSHENPTVAKTEKSPPSERSSEISGTVTDRGTADEAARQELIDQHRAQKKAMRNLPCKPADNKKFTFVRYADDWLAGVCGTKAECEDLKAEIAEFLSTELKLTLSEEKTLITHSSEKVRFIGYDICVRRNQEVKGHRMKNGTWRKSRTLHMKVALSVPHTEKIEKFMFAKKVIRQKENGEFQPIHRAGLLNLADYEIVEQYNAEARGLCNYYNLACDYHTLDYFCYLMEYSCLKTIANKHKTSIRKIIRQYKDGKTWSVPYETKAGTKRVRPVKIADCKRGEASDIIYQRKKFSWKTTIRQRLNARVCELCGCKEADLYEVHVIRNLNELGNSDWETVMKKKRRKTLVVCSKCHERIHRH